jgi:hypothetical protein
MGKRSPMPRPSDLVCLVFPLPVQLVCTLMLLAKGLSRLENCLVVVNAFVLWGVRGESIHVECLSCEPRRAASLGTHLLTKTRNAPLQLRLLLFHRLDVVLNLGG